MTRNRSKLSLVAVVGFMAMLGVTRSDAGNTYLSLGCIKNTDGSGHCWGNFLGARSSATSSDEVGFYEDFYVNAANPNGAETQQFWINSNSVATTCFLPASSGVAFQDVWRQVAMTNRGYFYVAFSSTGSCTEVYVGNDSAMGNY
jgi:hypothetical protein